MKLPEAQIWPGLPTVWNFCGLSVALKIKSKLLPKGYRITQPGPMDLPSLTPLIPCAPGPLNLPCFLPPLCFFTCWNSFLPFYLLASNWFLKVQLICHLFQKAFPKSSPFSHIAGGSNHPLCSQLPGLPWSQNSSSGIGLPTGLWSIGR